MDIKNRLKMANVKHQGTCNGPGKKHLFSYKGKRSQRKELMGGGSTSIFGSDKPEPKWDSVSSYCRQHRADRGPVQCRKCWSNMISDFKKIKTWESQADGSSESYWIISNNLRREKRLPDSFDRKVYNVLDGKEVSAEAYQLALVTIITDDKFGYGIETVEEEKEEENDDVSHTGEYTMEDDVLPPATEEVGSNPLKEGDVKDKKAKSIPSPSPISDKAETIASTNNVKAHLSNRIFTNEPLTTSLPFAIVSADLQVSFNVFVLVTLRWYHWDEIEFGLPPEYIGGSVTEFFDKDVDMIFYFELRDNIKYLGYSTQCDFFVKWDGYLIEIKCDKVIFDIVNMLKNGDELEVYVSHRVSQPDHAPLQLKYVPNTSGDELEAYVSHRVSQPDHAPLQLKYVPNTSDNGSFDPTIDEDPSDDDLEDDSDLEGNTSRDSDVDSDVHQEYINIRASKRHFNRSQRRSRGTTDEQVNVGEKGPDIRYDESNVGTRDSLVGKLGGDETYYLSDEASSFELDSEVGWGDGEDGDELQEIIRKELDIHVGATTVRRSRSRALQEIMGDHIVEYGRIFYYRDELLRTNPGSICVVKVGDADETGQDGNNQMLSIAWAVTKVENQFIRRWFIELLKNEGHQLSIISNMQKMWCKRYFEEHCKCNVVDNNMAESFNAWVLPARFKTIITMLEKIRVKMMKRIGVVLIVDIVSRSGSCRVWQLRGIPCPHSIIALHHKEYEPINFTDTCYHKDTYLSTYAHFIQPMNNMKIWPTSNNPTVKPPKIRKLPGRPPKIRRKEADESRKTEKLSKCGTARASTGRGKQGVVVQVMQLEHLIGKRGIGRGMPPQRQDHEENSGGHTRPFKMPRMVGIRIYHTEDGFTTINPRIPSRRVINTGAKVTKRFDIVTGAIGYTPRQGFKWKGKSATTNSKPERMKAEKFLIHTFDPGLLNIRMTDDINLAIHTHTCIPATYYLIATLGREQLGGLVMEELGTAAFVNFDKMSKSSDLVFLLSEKVMFDIHKSNVAKLAAGLTHVFTLSMALTYLTVDVISHVLIYAYTTILGIFTKTKYSFQNITRMQKYLKDPSKFTTITPAPIPATFCDPYGTQT
ncbi:putative magnesium protoporphyrin IX methyltransferase, chloroplastic-like [Capsicum annuum]|nr:putative magnesium protoporphyrin IX methyltransferase, chloroplastic-like [Capsicum annuum]